MCKYSLSIILMVHNSVATYIAKNLHLMFSQHMVYVVDCCPHLLYIIITYVHMHSICEKLYTYVCEPDCIPLRFGQQTPTLL